MTSSFDIYLIILVIGIVSVVMWEAAKAALRRANPVARLRAMAPHRFGGSSKSQRLTGAECDELSALMRIPIQYATGVQNSRIRELAARITTTSGPTARATSSTSPPGLTLGQREGDPAPLPSRDPFPQGDHRQHPDLTPPPPFDQGQSRATSSTSENPFRRGRAPPRLVGTEVQTDVTGPIARAFTRMEPQVRVERHVHPGPYLCLPGRPVVHFRHDCWAFRNVDRRKLEARTLCEVCINNGEPQYPLHG